MKGSEYWKPLGNTISEYMDSEYKFDRDTGNLKRKYIVYNDIKPRSV